MDDEARQPETEHGGRPEPLWDADYASPWKGRAWPARQPGEDPGAWLDVVRRLPVERMEGAA